MITFYIDNNGVYTSYHNLIELINTQDPVTVDLVEKDFVLFFTNLIKALCNDIDILLLDNDFSENELKSINEGISNTLKVLPNHHPFHTWEDVINRLRQSNSRITIFTSGTTGQPQKVQHNIKSLIREVRKGEKYENNVWGFSYNPTHMAGLQVFFQAIINQNTMVDLYKLTKDEILSRIERYHITHISATPTFYRLLIPCERAYPSVLKTSIGGEKSDDSLISNLRKVFPEAKINNIYASTEAGTILSTDGENFRIPEDKKTLLRIAQNELLIHKDLLAAFNDQELEDNWYRTGDLVEWVDESRDTFKFVSRKNQMINTGGFKVNPLEVEDLIRRMEGISDVYVFGKKNTVLGNIVCAQVCLKKDVSITEVQIKQYLSGKLQEYKIPRKINFVESIELGRTGKIKRV